MFVYIALSLSGDQQSVAKSTYRLLAVVKVGSPELWFLLKLKPSWSPGTSETQDHSYRLQDVASWQEGFA